MLVFDNSDKAINEKITDHWYLMNSAFEEFNRIEYKLSKVRVIPETKRKRDKQNNCMKVAQICGKQINKLVFEKPEEDLCQIL